MTTARRAGTTQALLLTAGAAVAWVGCDKSLTAAPAGQLSRAGTIVEVGQEIVSIERSDQLMQVWVRQDPDCGTIFIITDETVIRVRRPDGSVKQGSLDDLSTGEEVQVWSGIIQLSCPGLGTANWVLVLG